MASNIHVASAPADTVSEQTPLLSQGHSDAPPKRNRLPTFQLLILLSIRLADNMTLTSITPYINQMMYELPIVGGDQRRVGYYTGITASVYYAAEAATVLHWNRLSDHVGRKPILLFGLLGTIVSITMFGLSRSFWSLVLCRFFSGALNGNVGVSKSVLAELADESNVARAFSFLPLVFVVGQVIGSSVGGFLSRPQDRWPDYFPQPFWAEYPYFLPCLVVASFSLIQFTIAAIFFEETLSRKTSAISRPQESTNLQQDEEPAEQPLPLRSLLTRPVVISIANYGTIALLEIAASALIPLVWSTAIELGGLGLTPADIGLWMSAYGCVSAVFQFAFFPRVVAHFGPGRVVVATVVAFGLLYALFPFENMLARGTGTAGVVWPLIVLQLIAISVTDMGFSSVFMFVSSAAPNKRSLGALNGLAQTVVSTQRAVGPAAAASLFAFSLQNNILGGQFAYAVLLSFACVGLCVAVQLPRNTWKS
ncbi:MFS general substrate transporter [Lactarius akahatsu]|uniref:MFS general substrate transporter n=1 Tax=Lactarius akahatsu TaxID=416441 RepID=A0AAD4LD40_9AGAM|nr:MFS general substrate transporter [Lactarius akahatsu]